MWKAAIVT